MLLNYKSYLSAYNEKQGRIYRTHHSMLPIRNEFLTIWITIYNRLKLADILKAFDFFLILIKI